MIKKLGATLFIGAVSCSTSALSEEDLLINGFLSAGFGVQSTDEVTIGTFDEDITVKEDTILGVQLYKKINNEFSLTGQLVARGVEKYDVNASWAYATYQPTPETYFRAGRIRFTLFHFSDYQEVGYSYLWTRPPSEVYQYSLASMDAIDINHTENFGDITGEFQFYAGQLDDELDGVVFESNNMVGIIAKFTYENLVFRTSAHNNKSYAESEGTFIEDLIALDENFKMDGDNSNFYSLSFAYDNGTNLLLGEWTKNDNASALYADNVGWLVMYGHRLGDYTYHLTYAKYETNLESGSTGSFQESFGYKQEESSVIGGVRYDISDGVALKFEVQYNDEKIANGFDGKSGYLYSTVVDMIF